MTDEHADAVPEWIDLAPAVQDEAATATAGAAADGAPESQQDLSATDERPGTTGRRAVTHNKHDVGALEQECQRLHVAIAERGAQVDVAALTARAQAFTAIKLLVERGLCTEAEAQAALLTEIRNALGGILQSVEVARLQQQQQQGRQVQPVRQPDLIVPASHTMRQRQD